MTLTWQTLLAVGIGGFLGAITRVYANAVITKALPGEFPYGILTVNVVGSFIIGVLFALFLHYTFPTTVKAFLTSGFLGALTTYSTFAIESFLLLESSLLLGITNMFFNLFGTVFAAGMGYKIVTFFLK
jgi:CrcB protein